MCDCITKVDQQLAEHNTRLSVGFAIVNNTMTARVLLKTTKVNPGSRKPLMTVSAMFCPFCGKKQVDEKATPAAAAAVAPAPEVKAPHG